MSLEDVIKNLQDLARRAAALNGEHSVPINEMFNDEFMLRNTDFDSISGMLDASGYTIKSSSDFDEIPDGKWDEFVRNRTRFDSWQEMKSAAAQAWANQQLGLK